MRRIAALAAVASPVLALRGAHLSDAAARHDAYLAAKVSRAPTA